MTVGRNELCPCGSGRKYKKCHGASGATSSVIATESTRATTLKEADVRLRDDLMRFARKRYGPTWLQDVLDARGLLVDGIVPDAEFPFVLPWLAHCAVNESGRTLAEEAIHRASRAFPPDERALVQAYREAWVSIWKVEEVQRGVGSRIRDLLTHEERFVHDASSSAILQRFDSILAIVVTCDGISFFGGVHAQPLPPLRADEVVRVARRLCRVRTRPVAAARLRDPALQRALLIMWIGAVDEMVNAPLPELRNTDGDPMALTTDEFALIRERAEIARHLANLEGAEEDEAEEGETVFVVTRPGNAMHRSWDTTVVGRAILSENQLRLETNSTRRADSLRSIVQARLGGLVRFRTRTQRDAQELLDEMRYATPTRPTEAEPPPSPELDAAMREFRERHLREWLDESIPLLGGLTPREAAQRPRARAQLELLVEEMEQQEAREPERTRIDLRWLRSDLGLG